MVESNMAMATSKRRDQSSKKKIRKMINKSERAKTKRLNLNQLFLALAASLELCGRKNKGKASVLIEATRVVNDMLAQIDCLKKENSALLSESQYVTVERNELRDENSTLEAEIGGLQREMRSKVSLDLNISPPNQEALHKRDGLMSPHFEQDGQIGHPLRLCSNIQGYSRHVSKPHARYPAPADQWPLQVLPELG